MNRKAVLLGVISGLFLLILTIQLHLTKQLKVKREFKPNDDIIAYVTPNTKDDISKNLMQGTKNIKSTKNHGDVMLKVSDVTSTMGDVNDYVMPRIVYLKEPDLDFEVASNDCLKSKSVSWQMVFFIKSAAGNYMRRELLRRTWASLSYLEGAKFYTIFVVGNPPGGNKGLLNEESERYKDILQFDGPDDYKNVVLKTLAGMQWSSSRLPSSIFYSSGDDDFLVNISLLKQLVDQNISMTKKNDWPEFPIICTYKKLTGEFPVRAKGYKSTISKDIYKWPKYPKTCLGGLYTTSVSIIKQLFQIARTTKPLAVDDVWVTGILRHKIGMPDEMVVEHKLNIATHYKGFAEKESDLHRGFMTKEWEPIFDSFRSKSLCLKF